MTEEFHPALKALIVALALLALYITVTL